MGKYCGNRFHGIVESNPVNIGPVEIFFLEVKVADIHVFHVIIDVFPVEELEPSLLQVRIFW